MKTVAGQGRIQPGRKARRRLKSDLQTWQPKRRRTATRRGRRRPRVAGDPLVAEATDSGKVGEQILFFFQWPQPADEERQALQLKLIMFSRVANMAPKKHIWMAEEEEYMMEYTKRPAAMETYRKCKVDLFRQIAAALNERSGLPPDYVQLTAEKVKSKFTILYSKWKAHCSSDRQVGTSSGTLMTRYGSEFSTLFGSNEATSSASVQRTNKKAKAKEATEATDYKTALNYLHDCGVRGTELYSCASALRDEHALSCFLVMKTFRERKQLLNDLLVSRIRSREEDISKEAVMSSRWCLFLLFLLMCIKGAGCGKMYPEG
ncbi:hypothetical protein ACP70R_040034 [Stipagrostis hirtigluma subsp. patula]